MAEQQDAPSKELAAILAGIPAADAKTAAQAGRKLAAGGPAMVEELVALVGQEFGDPDGVMPKYALHGLAVYAGRPDADADRKMVAETLARHLQADHSAELKAFIVRQLQFCGRGDEVPALAKLLTDRRLCEAAAQALLAIGGDKAAAALRGALAKVKGKLRVTILNGLGRLRDGNSAAAARKAAGDPDTDVRLAALYALGSMGDPKSVAVQVEAAEAKGGYERTQTTDACLLLARRLAEQGDTKNAGKICRHLLGARKTPQDTHDRCAALAVLAETVGVEAVGDVMAAMGSKDLRMRNPAARTAVKLAEAIAKDHAVEAGKLLMKVLEATKEQAVRRQAELLLAQARE